MKLIVAFSKNANYLITFLSDWLLYPGDICIAFHHKNPTEIGNQYFLIINLVYMPPKTNQNKFCFVLNKAFKF